MSKQLVHLVVNDKREIVVEALREPTKDLGLLSDIRIIKVYGNSVFRDICSRAPAEANTYIGAIDFVCPFVNCIDSLNTQYTSVMYAQIAEEQYKRALPIEEKAREETQKQRLRREISRQFSSGSEDGQAD